MAVTSSVKLIGLDLDGTVVADDNTIPQANLDAIRSCHSAGIRLAFLTGRRPLTAKPHLDAIGVPCFVATNSGCLLWDYPAWNQLDRRIFPPGLLEPVSEMIYPNSANFHVDASLTGFEFFHLDRNSNPALEEYMRRYGKNVKRIVHASEMLGYDITQMAMPSDDPAVVEAFAAEAAERFGSELLALAVRWPLMNVLALELFHPDANKGSALRFFAGRVGASREDCIAVGDDVNDLAMVSWAGQGVAMPGAVSQLAAAADIRLAGTGAAALAGFLTSLLAG